MPLRRSRRYCIVDRREVAGLSDFPVRNHLIVGLCGALSIRQNQLCLHVTGQDVFPQHSAEAACEVEVHQEKKLIWRRRTTKLTIVEQLRVGSQLTEAPWPRQRTDSALKWERKHTLRNLTTACFRKAHRNSKGFDSRQ